MHPSTIPRPAIPARLVLLLVLGALLVQLPLIANPGYFSHDELQWAVRADEGAPPGWGDIDALQYRPLTFAVWMGLSRMLFDTPQAFHLALALMGAVNAALLAWLLSAAGAARKASIAAALLLVASPYAVYVQGWVGTIGDLLWVGFGLATGLIALRGGTAATAAASAILTLLALLAKEAALSIPAAGAVLVVLDASRRRTWIAATAASGAVALAYLAVRYPALAAARPGDAYAWSLANIPARWIEYQLYPAAPRVFEVHNTLAAPFSIQVVGSGLLWLGLLAVLARRGVAWLAAYLAGSIATLGPVLVLGGAATQYGYGFAAWSIGLVALAWSRLGRPHRVVVAVFAIAIALHGLFVGLQINRVGRIHARFADDLTRVLATADQAVVLAPESRDDAWIFMRLTHEVPSYRGVPLSPRLRLVDAGRPADYTIRPDGAVVPAR